jgi:hypothetical protein
VTDTNPQAQSSREQLLTAAQTLLSSRLGAQIHLTEVERLTEEDSRNDVIRCTLADAPQGAPVSVVIKQVVSEHYSPDNADSWDTQRFFCDWAGAEFLSTLPTTSAHSARFFGGNRDQGFIILEDLGAHHSLIEPLLEGDAQSAEHALLTFAAGLGQMHADTIGAAAHFERITQIVNPILRVHVQSACLQQGAEFQQMFEQLRAQFDGLGLPIATETVADIGQITESVARPGPFLAFVHGDPCPDNTFYSDSTLRLIDFEFGKFSHALRDGVYSRMFFPTCWCANRIPEALVARMEQNYRAELSRTCPAAQDDHLFETGLVHMCGYWLIATLWWHLADALKEDRDWGIATMRPRFLARLQAFIGVSQAYGQLPALRGTASALLEHLQARWPEIEPLPVYPAFR